MTCDECGGKGEVERAKECNIPLLKAFKSAGVPTSTYYRTINGATELRHETARKVMKAIEKLHALEAARDHTKQLRSAGKRVDIRKTRAEFKPRKTGA
jgi:predicted transcriptional regulator